MQAGVTFNALEWHVTRISSVVRVCQRQLGFLIVLISQFHTVHLSKYIVILFHFILHDHEVYSKFPALWRPVMGTFVGTLEWLQILLHIGAHCTGCMLWQCCFCVCLSCCQTLMIWLHWLPVCALIDFKIATLTYKALSSGQPACLCELIPAITSVSLYCLLHRY